MILFWIAFIAALGVSGDLERNVKTAYDAQGRPAFQSENNRGLHRIIDSTALSDGRDTVFLNTSVAKGRQDVSFYSKASYHGAAWSTDVSDSNTYRVVPLTGSSFLILSSDTSDDGTVNFMVEGM